MGVSAFLLRSDVSSAECPVADSHEYQKVNGQYDDGHLDSDIRNHEITGEKLCQVGMGKQIIFNDFIVL